jgi:probable phosphoglycerate mutase
MSSDPAKAQRLITRLLLVRHGESVATVQRRLAGVRSCRGLSPLGVEQAERLAARLAAGNERSIDVVVTSPLTRAMETAQILAPALKLEPVVDPDWEEHRPGEVDGMRFDEIVSRYGSPAAGHDPDSRWWPGAETMREFRERVVGAVEGAVAAWPGKNILVSCHGGVIDVVFRHVLGLSPEVTFDLWTLNTAITEFALDQRPARDSRWRLVRYNDAAHLAGLPTSTPQPAAPTG